jgi:hypothetical protein
MKPCHTLHFLLYRVTGCTGWEKKNCFCLLILTWPGHCCLPRSPKNTMDLIIRSRSVLQLYPTSSSAVFSLFYILLRDGSKKLILQFTVIKPFPFHSSSSHLKSIKIWIPKFLKPSILKAMLQPLKFFKPSFLWVCIRFHWRKKNVIPQNNLADKKFVGQYVNKNCFWF